MLSRVPSTPATAPSRGSLRGWRRARPLAQRWTSGGVCLDALIGKQVRSCSSRTLYAPPCAGTPPLVHRCASGRALAVGQTEGGTRAIRAYDLSTGGTVSNRRVLYDFYPGRRADGMAIDQQGNLYAAAGLHRRRGTHETLDTKCGVYAFTAGQAAALHSDS